MKSHKIHSILTNKYKITEKHIVVAFKLHKGTARYNESEDLSPIR